MKTRLFKLFALTTSILLMTTSCEGQNRNKSMDNTIASLTPQEEVGKLPEDSESYSAKPGKQITATIDESGLNKKQSVNVGDGERNYYKYDKAALGTVTVTLSDIPESLDDIKNIKLPRGISDIHNTPYLCPALFVCALNQAFVDKEECKAMLNYIGKRGHDINTGVVDAYPSDWSQLYQYKSLPSILSYFEGATKQNKWTPSKPITMKMQLTQYSYTADEFVIRLLIKSAAKASPQYIEIWMEDTDDDGNYDFFYPVNYINLAHSLGVYK